MRDLEDKMDGLRHCHLFSSLELLALKRMTLHFRFRTFRPHDWLFVEGDEMLVSYLVVEGQVELSRQIKVDIMLV
jgi:CRP-like cAMP-binding protein